MFCAVYALLQVRKLYVTCQVLWNKLQNRETCLFYNHCANYYSWTLAESTANQDKRILHKIAEGG